MNTRTTEQKEETDEQTKPEIIHAVLHFLFVSYSDLE